MMHSVEATHPAEEGEGDILKDISSRSGSLYKAAFLATAGATFGLLPAHLTGALAVQLRAELGFGVRALGAAVALFFTASALASTVAGRTVDRIGAYRGMQVSSALSAASLVGIAAIADSWILLIPLLMIGGIASSMAFVTANLFLVRSISSHEQGWAFAIRQSGAVVSPLLAGLAVPFVALTIGWRWAFAIAGIGALLFGVSLRGAFRRPWTKSVDINRRNDASYRALIVVAGAAGLATAVAAATAAFLVEASVSAGLSDSQAGLLLGAGGATALAISLIVGARADRPGAQPLRVAASLLGVGAFGHTLLAIQVSWLMWPAAMLSFGTYWGWGGLLQYTVATRNPNLPGRATGITQTGTWIGAVLGPLGFGLLAASFSYRAAWLIASLCALLSTLLMVWSHKLLD